MLLREASPGTWCQGKPRQVVEKGPDHLRTGQRTNSHSLQNTRVKQMGSCDSIIHIIPEKPLTRPQITTLMLFSPLTPPQPSALPFRERPPASPPNLPASPFRYPRLRRRRIPFPGNLDASDKCLESGFLPK